MRQKIEAAIAAITLLVSAPLLAISAIAIFAQDRKSPIFAQERLGQHEQTFTLLKLRTMRPETPNVTSHSLTASAITPLGARLRSAKLDELPQLINVIKGEMALVGPRPGLPSDHALTAARRNFGVFEAPPGITGLAQVQGIDMSEPERLAKTDSEYIRTKSIRTDLNLLVQTALGGGRGDAIGA